MKAELVLKKLKGWNLSTKIVSAKELPSSLCQKGGDCDCRGCDKD